MTISLLHLTLILNALTLATGGYFVNQQNNRIVELSDLLIKSQNALIVLEGKIKLITVSSKLLNSTQNSLVSATGNNDINLFLIKCTVCAACVLLIGGGAYYGVNAVIATISSSFPGKLLTAANLTGIKAMNYFNTSSLPQDSNFKDSVGNEILLRYFDPVSPHVSVKFLGGDNTFHHTSELILKITNVCAEANIAVACAPEINSGAAMAANLVAFS